MLVCWSAFLLAATATDQISQAKKLYYSAIDGDKAAVQNADQLWILLHQQRPDDPLVTVYFGSLRLLEAQHTWALWKKNALSRQGIQSMDGAVAAAPGNLEVLFVRGATERELPDFFGRKKQSMADIASIVKALQMDRQQGLAPRLASATFYYYGLDCERTGENAKAMQAWRTSVRIAPDSQAGRGAAEKLKALR